jgi:transposase
LRCFLSFDSLGSKGEIAMSDLMLLSEAQMRRIEPYFPLSHGVPRVDDRLILSGIILFCVTGCGGVTLQGSMARTRRSITVSSDGAGSVCSIGF